MSPGVLRAWATITFTTAIWLGNASAQTNSWTKPTSGYWEEPYWSLGALPGPDQAIVFTNEGWKALAIGPSTVQSHPETLNVQSLIIGAPSYTFNELLLNFAGAANPLMINGPLFVYTNAAVVVLASALEASFIAVAGGSFSQGEYSQVSASELDLGGFGPGSYNLTNGSLRVGTANIGATFPASFNQFGGTNTGQIQLLPNGVYNLLDGYLQGEMTSFGGGTVEQSGGTNYANGLFFAPTEYHLSGGSFATNVYFIETRTLQ